jgi:DNA-binding response OmpR family regulator
MGYTVLIAEDDRDIVEVLKLYLGSQGFSVLSAPDGEEALSVLKSNHVDLGIFDIMMPKMNGYDLIKEVRKTMNIPIIILSARQEDSDKIIGLDLGADDYLTKPFAPLEVIARVKAQIRRYYDLNTGSSKESDTVSYGDLKADLNSFTLTKRGQNIDVTPTELKILIFLMKSPNRVYTKAQIYEHLRGTYFDGDENSIMVHISNLRSKIEDDYRHPRYIITVRGLGYKFAEDRVLANE